MTLSHAPNSDAAKAQPTEPTPPRIYVACLASYNNGILHGRWITVTDPATIRTDVQSMLAASPNPYAEEWAIHDYEGFEDCHLSEYASFDTVCDLADYITEYGELGAKLYTAFGSDLSEARAAFEDYAGQCNSAAEFAEQLHEDIGTQIPQSLQYYIDWQSLARDMALNGEIMVFQLSFDEVHIFWRR